MDADKPRGSLKETEGKEEGPRVARLGEGSRGYPNSREAPLSSPPDEAFKALRIEPFSSPPELPDVMKPQDSGSSANEQAVQ